MNYIDTRDVACADCGATYTMGERHVCPYVPASLANLIRGNMNRHTNAQHHGMTRGNCEVCQQHLDALARAGEDRRR